MVKSPIKVFVRVRPVPKSAAKGFNASEEESWVHLNIPKNEARGHINHQPENFGFRFDGVVTSSSQEKVYNRVAKETITSALEGYSGTIFCYGQTGAGKTFTMSGSSSSYKDRGIIPRMISGLFQEIQARPDQHTRVRVSYLEIYNEALLDLLAGNQSRSSVGPVNEDGTGGSINQIECKNEQDGLNLFFEGEMLKATAQHNMNQNSSRSHLIFTIYIQTKSKEGSRDKFTYSKINLVDLAGSERTKKSGSEGQTLVEANHINKSLSFLEQVVVALSEKQRDHVPYRQSKLTYLLRDSIGGNCKTIMIANIWPEHSNMDETISTLKFATRMMKVSNDAIANVQLESLSPFRKHRKDESSFRVGSFNSGEFNEDESLNTEERDETQDMARRFLSGDLDDLEIKSSGHLKELLSQFRKSYMDLYNATKPFFHLIPENKRIKIGIEGTCISKKSSPEPRNYNDESDEDLVTKRYSTANFSALDKHESELSSKSRSTVKESIPKPHQQPEKPTRINLESIKTTTSSNERDFNQKLLTGMAGMIRQRDQSRDLLDQISKSRDSKDFSQIQQEQESLEENYDASEETRYRYTKNLNEIKKRFKQQTEKINELKLNILSADQNIKRSKSLVIEKIEEILQPRSQKQNVNDIRSKPPKHPSHYDYEDSDTEVSSYSPIGRKAGFVYRMKD